MEESNLDKARETRNVRGRRPIGHRLSQKRIYLPMIVSRELGFVFMHNPKVAGTSVRDVLEPLRDTPFDFANNYPDPLTGERIIDRSHIGIDEFAHFYPDIWQTTLSLPFFALYRDPKSRFLAAVNQYSKMYGDVDIRFADQAKRSAFFKKLLEALDALGVAENAMENHEYAFFRPQWIFLKSERADAKNLDIRPYPVSAFKDFAADISNILGRDLHFARENSSEQFSVGGPMGAILSNNTIKKSLRRLPGAMTAMSLLRKSRKTDTERENLQPEVRYGLNDRDLEAFDRFIARFYAKDFDHFRALGTPFDRVYETNTV
ncbi:hypothetical protein [Celeribacter sp.]|uniref:hypothetical protein n=1 Tax=Celeribacter sp. TaxID=1890673 RepID=UPI003A93AE1B